MRTNPTVAEAAFWKMVRRRNIMDLKFNRQFLIRYRIDQDILKYYIADFYNHENKLIIEIDGLIHKHRVEYDLIRSETMKSLGYNVLRFDNDEVLNHSKDVIEKLKIHINELQQK